MARDVCEVSSAWAARWSEGVIRCVCVCVCHSLSPRVFTSKSWFQAGALSTPWQTQCNEAMPWSGKHGLITRVYLQQFGTVEHAVQFALLVSMVLHATYPSPFSFSHFQQPRVLQPVTAVVRDTFFKHLQVIGRSTLLFSHFFPPGN